MADIQSSGAPSASKAASKPSTDLYAVFRILEEAGKALREADAGLDIELPTPAPKLPELLEAILPVIRSSAAASGLDVSLFHKLTPQRRARLRALALEMRDLMLAPDANTAPMGRPIFSAQDLTAADRPNQLTREQRQKLSAKFDDSLPDDGRIPEPYLLLPVSREDRFLPTVQANMEVKAVDAERDDPAKSLNGVDCLWDTGSHYTVISEDLLQANYFDFAGHLHKDPKNAPFRQTVGWASRPLVKVQVSAVVNVSNDKIRLDTVALVVPRETIPNQRSGVLFGQRMTIERVHYVSIPRSILAAEGRDPGEEYWGAFDVVRYLTDDDVVVEGGSARPTEQSVQLGVGCSTL